MDAFEEARSAWVRAYDARERARLAAMTAPAGRTAETAAALASAEAEWQAAGRRLAELAEARRPRSVPA